MLISVAAAVVYNLLLLFLRALLCGFWNGLDQFHLIFVPPTSSTMKEADC